MHAQTDAHAGTWLAIDLAYVIHETIQCPSELATASDMRKWVADVARKELSEELAAQDPTMSWLKVEGFPFHEEDDGDEEEDGDEQVG